MISRILAVLTLLALSASASAFTARTGHWYNPAESGSGYNIDIQDGVLVVTIFSGTIVITFTSETSATVLLPGGRMTTIRPFNFGFGTPPQGLLGQWVYVETIAGVDFADRYSFTTILGATAEGNGIVNDFDKFASCELQVTGEIAGLVVCGHWTDSTYTV